MKHSNRQPGIRWLLAAVAAWPMLAFAQVPVDDDGNPIGDFDAGPGNAGESLEVLTAAELDTLIGPIALYPDDLLAIILPASTYPLQIVEAGRFLQRLESDSSLEPDPDWDDSVVALTNYPEVVEMLNEDLDWTWRLGEAVVAQQTDVISAIERFRDSAYAAGNLKSDDFQKVTEEDGAIRISPVQEDVIYVPYYEPERVVVYQPRPVYYYYPRAYPLYYYPYPVGYAFDSGYFWGVTTAFAIGWHSHNLHVWHHSYHGHPYYGHRYWNNWWYRRPDIHVHNNYYVNNSRYRSYNRYQRGDVWHPRVRRTIGRDQRVTRTRYYPNAGTRTATAGDRRSSNVRPRVTTDRAQRSAVTRRGNDTPAIRFRDRSNDGARTTPVNPRNATRATTDRPATVRRSVPNARLRDDRADARQPTIRRSTAEQRTSRPRATITQPRNSTSRPSGSVKSLRAGSGPKMTRQAQSSRSSARPSRSAPKVRSAPSKKSQSSGSSGRRGNSSRDRRDR